jgi:hypothetical protein
LADLPRAVVCTSHALGMFVVTEADAAAIRAILSQEGELSAAIELRQRFPGVNRQREGAGVRTEHRRVDAVAATVVPGDAAASPQGHLVKRRTSPRPPEGLLLRLGREQQRIAFASASVRRAGCFGFRHISCVDGDDTSAAPMSGHHHSQRLIIAHAEFRLQNHDDELAGREVIIDQDDFMQTRPFDLYLILGLGLGGGANHVRTAFVGHGSCEIIAA